VGFVGEAAGQFLKQNAAKEPRETAVIVQRTDDSLPWMLPKVERWRVAAMPQGIGA